jgi:hypothetical protein
MIALGSPGWLVGLALVPLIRALHRWRGHETTCIVPAAFLWSDADTPSAVGTRHNLPDPAWRRRALAAALLVLTMAAPGWRTGGPRPLEILVDNRPSLLTRESDGRRRIDQAALTLAGALSQSNLQGDGNPIRLIATDGRTTALEVDGGDRTGLTQALEQLAMQSLDPEPFTPLPSGAARARRWLVSDGVSAIETLAAQGPFNRVWALGSETENQGISRLAARLDLDSTDHLDILVTVVNAGRWDAVRTLVLSMDNRDLERVVLRLPAGAVLTHSAMVTGSGPGEIETRLEPADALTSDDRMMLDPGPAIPIGVQVSGACPPPVEAFLAAHPGLRRDAGTGAGLRVWCAALEPPDAALPTLWLPPGEPIADAAGPIRWLQPGSVPPSLLQSLAPGILMPIAPVLHSEGKTLLSMDGHPLVIERPGVRCLIGLFAAGSDVSARSPGLPLLVDWLLGRLLGRELLFPIALRERPPESLRVAPGPLPAAAPESEYVADDRPVYPLWPVPLVIAMAALWLDLRRLPGHAPR